MVTQGFWNVREKGEWYQFQSGSIGRIGTPGDSRAYSMLKDLQDYGVTKLARVTLIPFALPLKQNLSYVYTVDLDLAQLTIAFWHQEEANEAKSSILTMRRLKLDAIKIPSDFSIDTLLQYGSDPLADNPASTGPKLAQEGQFKRWEIEMSQPTCMNELQHRMFRDFVYQWRFFIDDRTIWHCASAILFRRLSYAFLRLAAWDFTISPESKVVKLPLGAASFPAWDCPRSSFYWFHQYLIVISLDLGTFSQMSAAVSKAKDFVGHRKSAVECILISLIDIAFVRILPKGTQCSPILPLLRDASARECSAGFRMLVYLLTSPRDRDIRRCLTTREVSVINCSTEVLGLILNTVAPEDIVTFAQASHLVEDWYYISLPQLPSIKINRLQVSISCCARRTMEEGLHCTVCYAWQHSNCAGQIDNSARQFLCSNCQVPNEQDAPLPKLIPGAIGRANRRVARPDECRVMVSDQEKVLRLRVSAPAALRPDLRLRDPDLTSTLPNQIDYAVLFGGMWSGLAYGIDDVVPKPGLYDPR